MKSASKHWLVITAVSVGCILLLCTTATGIAAQIPVHGEVHWQISDQTVKVPFEDHVGDLTGKIDPDAYWAWCEMHWLDTQPLTNPYIVVNSFFCIICSIVCEQTTIDAQNLMDITGGNYTLTRIYQFEGLPDCYVRVDATVAFDGDSLETIAFYSGNWNGPSGFTGVSDWTHTLFPGHFGAMGESGSAMINGPVPIRATWRGQYNFDGELASPQTAMVEWINQEIIDGGMGLSLEWTGSVSRSNDSIPTLTEWGFITFGALLLASVVFYIWRRRRFAVVGA